MVRAPMGVLRTLPGNEAAAVAESANTCAPNTGVPSFITTLPEMFPVGKSGEFFGYRLDTAATSS